MKKIILLCLIPFLFAAPAYASTHEEDVEGRAFVHRNGTIIIAVDVEMDDADLAQMGVTIADADYLEEELDILILMEEKVTGSTLRGLGADSAYMYGFMDKETMEPGLLLVASEGKHVYMFLMMGDLEDVEPFAQFTWDVIHDGLADADEPAGYVEMELDDEVLPSSL